MDNKEWSILARSVSYDITWIYNMLENGLVTSSARASADNSDLIDQITSVLAMQGFKSVQESKEMAHQYILP